MAANAASVSATTIRPSSPYRKLKTDLRRSLDGLDATTVFVSVAILLLAALLCTLVWQEREDKKRDAFENAVDRIELVADLAASELNALLGANLVKASHLAALAPRIPAANLVEGRTILLANPEGDILVTEPRGAFPATLPEFLGDLDAATLTPMIVTLQDGTKTLVAVRTVTGGHVAVTQPISAIRAEGSAVGGPAGILVAIALVALAGIAFARCMTCARSGTGPRQTLRARKRLELALNRSRCGLWDWDIATSRVVWSSSLFELLGYEPRESLSLGELAGIMHPEDRDLGQIGAQIATGEITQFDDRFRARTADGAWLWLRARGQVIRDDFTGTPHLVGIAVDVTSEEEAAQKTAAADERLRDAVEQISEAFVLWDADSKLVLCNSRFRQLHRLPPEAVQPGTAYSDIVGLGSTLRQERQVPSATGTLLGTRSLEAQLSDGRWLHINERRTRDGGYVSVGTDITELKRQQEKLVASEQRLTGFVKELKRSRRELQLQAQRLAELAERYHEQRDEAETASRAKTEFLGKMSHELRTPLNAILGFADVMRFQYLGPLGNAKYSEYASDIHASGQSLLAFIDDILRMSKIDAGTYELRPEPIDLRALLKVAVASVVEQAEAKSVALLPDLGTVGQMQADPGALRMIFTQLVRNAVKFTRPGGQVGVRVRLAGSAVHVFVSDDGIGIPDEFMPRVGFPFEQAETECNRASAGCGLGLALAKALTELHGGSLRIRSQQGVGTVVLVRIPLDQPSTAPDPKLVRMPQAAPPASSTKIWLEAAE